MSLINLKALEVAGLTSVRRRIGDAVTFSPGRVYFTKTFCTANGLKDGQRMHFINEGPEWRFFVNDDPDGFPLVADSKGGALQIFSAPLVLLFRKSLGNVPLATYEIVQTKLEQGGKPVYMILTNKPLKKGQ